MKPAWIATAMFVIAPTQTNASGDSYQTLSIPSVNSLGVLSFEKRSFVYPHYYAGAETATGGVFAAPCTKTPPKPDDEPYSNRAPYDPKCDRVNPLSGSGIAMTFGIAGADEPSYHGACTLTIDLARLRDPRLPQVLKAGFTTRKSLVELALRTLEANDTRALFDCAIAYTNTAAARVVVADLPAMFKPVVSCNATAGRRAIVATPVWKVGAAEQKLRDAVAADCKNVDALLDLASSLAHDERFSHALALLDRARAISETRAFDRFASDGNFDGLRVHARNAPFLDGFYLARKDRCTDLSYVPSTRVGNLVVKNGECLIITDKPFARLGKGQRWSGYATMFSDEKYRPDVVRRLRARDASTMVATAGTLAVQDFCKMEFFDFESISSNHGEFDRCAVSPAVHVLTKAELEERQFWNANRKVLMEIQELRQVLYRMSGAIRMSCTNVEQQRHQTCRTSGAKSCDLVKQNMGAICDGELRWQLDARHLDVKTARAHQRKLATGFLACVSKHYVQDVTRRECTDPYPSVSRWRPTP